jgi:ribulose kinase
LLFAKINFVKVLSKMNWEKINNSFNYYESLTIQDSKENNKAKFQCKFKWIYHTHTHIFTNTIFDSL